MKPSEILKLMIHDIAISESTKQPIVTLEFYYKDDNGNWVGAGPITLAVNNTISLFAEAMGAPVPLNDGEQDASPN